MPRTGVSYDDVVESIHILEKAGLNASIRNIRERIGKGSLTTIAEHKREYEIATASAPREALPDPIAKGLMKGAEAYWQELVEAAETEITNVQELANETVAELTARVAELEGNLVDAQEALNGESLAKKAVEDTLVVAESARTDLETQLQATSTELSALSARLDEARQAAEKADADRNQLASELKNAQGEVARLVERNDNAASKHASELAKLNSELADALSKNESLSEELESTRQAAEKAAQHAREQAARAKAAEKERKDAQGLVATLRDEVEQRRTSAAEARSSLETQLASQTALVEEKDARIADLQSANKALERALKSKKPSKKKKQSTKSEARKR